MHKSMPYKFKEPSRKYIKSINDQTRVYYVINSYGFILLYIAINPTPNCKIC